MKTIKLSPVGIIHTPYQQSKDIPIQGTFKPEGEGYVDLEEQYATGLKDLDGFSHAILIYYFHKSKEEHL
jgi:tRNA (adenine37-N6)-methyltransferase